MSMLLFVALTGAASAGQRAVPPRYVVVPGNTLWGIAQHFFADPWRWPGIWNRNRQIHNPDLIYPGDVIVLRYDHGRPELVDLGPASVRTPAALAARAGHRLPTQVLRPRIRVTALPQPVPTINPATIAPFLRHPLALSRRRLRRLGYVAAAVHGHAFIGPFSDFYARHLGPHPAHIYDIYQAGPSLRNSRGQLLAYETNYIGRAKLLRAGHPAELEVISAVREVHATDRLIPWHGGAPIPYYYPRAPRYPLHGHIVAASHDHVNLGTYAVLAMDIGRAAGMHRGYVLRIYTPAQRLRDPVTGGHFRAPPRPIGLIMVFRTFAHVSYGVVMQARQEILVGDGVAGP
ncbi:MAG: LysM peptidoglycan-binding domain-containing protein [Acidiferrobacter sp.]